MKTLNKSQLANRYNLDYSTVHRWAQEPDFPVGSPVSPTKTTLVYLVTEVDAWALANCGLKATRSRIRKLRKQEQAKAVIEPVAEVAEVNKPIYLPTATSTTLEVIVHLLERSPEKQRIVLDLLLD